MYYVLSLTWIVKFFIWVMFIFNIGYDYFYVGYLILNWLSFDLYYFHPLCVCYPWWTCYFFSYLYCVDAMGEGLEGRNKHKKNYYTSLNTWKSPHLLEEAGKPDYARIVASDNSRSECKNEIVTDREDFDDVNAEPSSPSGMWSLTSKLFIFDINYIYLWCVLWSSLMLIMFILDVSCDYLCRSFRLCSVFFYIHYSSTDITRRK